MGAGGGSLPRRYRRGGAQLPTNKVWSSRQGARASWPQARAFTAAPGPPRPRCSGRRTRARPGPRCGGRRVTASPGWAPPRARSWPPAWRTTVSARSCWRGPSGTSWRLIDVSVSPAVAPAVRGGQVASAIASLWGSYQFHFLNQSVGFAAPDPMVGQATFLPGVLLRTTDGGRRWAPVRFPGGTPTGGLRSVNAERGFATGAVAHAATSKRCPLDQIGPPRTGAPLGEQCPGPAVATS